MRFTLAHNHHSVAHSSFSPLDFLATAQGYRCSSRVYIWKEAMSLYKPYPTSSSSSGPSSHTTEFDILRSSHRFLHDDTDGKKELSWSDQLARKYYESLFREFAVCDLKHYKSGNVSSSLASTRSFPEHVNFTVRSSLADGIRSSIRCWRKDLCEYAMSGP